MQSDGVDLSLLENASVLEYECNDWVRNGVDGIEIDTNIDSQVSPNNGEANVEGGNDIENKRIMQTRGRNRLEIQQHHDEDVRHYIEQLMDDQNHSRAQPYIEQFINSQNHSDTQENEFNISAGGTEVQHNAEYGNTYLSRV
ncbi:hypothetical protein HAX54_005491 [Datura stramonium]|uniref:Uncharacterized protein n=1 Tax=Datura stramonium TaxID=4076 RepID=A0ABS8TB79_DATST|nr:hypothetical protein [Datura stramonium]